MRVRVTSIAKWLVYVTMAAALSLLKPIGEIIPAFGFDHLIRLANVILIGISLLLLMRTSRKWIGNRFVWGMAILVCGSLALRLFIDFIQGRNPYKELNAHSQYLYIILSIVIYDMMDRGIVSVDKLINIIISLTLLSYALRTSISWVYAISGKKILSSIALESAKDNWFREGTLRVNAPCFAMIMVPLCFYRINRVNKWKKKCYYIFCIAVTILFSAYVNCSRALVIYQSLEVLFCVCITRKSAIKKIIIVLIGLLVAGSLLGNGIIEYFVDMFSTSNKVYGYSNNVRMLETPYYFNVFIDNFWFGKGLLMGDELTFHGGGGGLGGGLGDCGVLRSLVLMGAPMLFYFLVWIGRDMIVGFKAVIGDSDSAQRILILGIIVSVMLTICSIDCFYPIFAYATPYALAISEYAITQVR